jgi:FkbM family methyltransferase
VLLERILADTQRIIHGIRSLPLHLDYRRNPVRALLMRAAWPVRWMFRRKPWLLPLCGSLKIAVGKDSHGAYLYYSRGQYDSDVRSVMNRLLTSGMTFIDVGAHFGLFTLLGAQAVGPEGTVYAFEPDPAAYSLLASNLRLNGFSNTHAYCSAVSDKSGSLAFDICKEATHSSLATRGEHTGAHAIVKTIMVDTLRLDDVLAGKKADLIKVDAEGAELMIFSGAMGLLSREPVVAPVWVFEYAPENYERFGYTPPELMRLLQSYDYGIWARRAGGRPMKIDPFNVPKGITDLIAIKEGMDARL